MDHNDELNKKLKEFEQLKLWNALLLELPELIIYDVKQRIRK